MKIDPQLLSDDYLNRVRRDVAEHITATSGEQEIERVRNLLGHIAALERAVDGTALREINALNLRLSSPIPMRLTCPACGELHIDEGEFATKPHHTHSCQSCGMTWRPAVVATVGVRFLPGFRNSESK